jgi:Polyketide cyclase / dehydrase and lipid transport
MTSIYRDIAIDRDAESAWAAVRRFDAAAELFAGVLVDCRCTGDVREVTFVGGNKIMEHLITRDDSRRRLVYAVKHEAYAHHSASMQILPDGAGCRFVWVSDFLPNERAAMMESLIDAGCRALKSSLERRNP